MPHRTRLSPAAHHFEQADGPAHNLTLLPTLGASPGTRPARRRPVLARAPALTTWLLSHA